MNSPHQIGIWTWFWRKEKHIEAKNRTSNQFKQALVLGRKHRPATLMGGNYHWTNPTPKCSILQVYSNN